jgi:HPt (histidine-containing phosphotransfer) domain-containing protein
MPVMDGLEAASKIIEMGVKTPIIALTANVMSNDMEIYRGSGMLDTLGKPFTSQELWGCLLNYLPVKNYTLINVQQRETLDEQLVKQLKSQFIKRNKHIYDEIIAAIEADDIKLAHRLAHTLKSNAGQLNKKALQSAAEEAENNFASEKNNVTLEQMKNLKLELNAVIDEFEAETAEASVLPQEPQAEADTLKLLLKVKPLLSSYDPECLKYTGALRQIAESGKMVEYMEDFDFKAAEEILDNLIKSYGG